MPRRPLQKPQPFKAFPGNAREKKRAKYLLAFLQTGSKAKAERLLISPRSPDLDPLDYSVFGAAKTRLASDLPLSATWEQRVARFKEILQAAPVDKAIRQMSLRASACIAAGGQHFEHTLKKRK